MLLYNKYINYVLLYIFQSVYINQQVYTLFIALFITIFKIWSVFHIDSFIFSFFTFLLILKLDLKFWDFY